MIDLFLNWRKKAIELYEQTEEKKNVRQKFASSSNSKKGTFLQELFIYYYYYIRLFWLFCFSFLFFFYYVTEKYLKSAVFFLYHI